MSIFAMLRIAIRYSGLSHTHDLESTVAMAAALGFMRACNAPQLEHLGW